MGATPTAWAADTGAGAARVSATSAHAELTGRHAETLRPLPRPAQRQPPRARRPLPGDQEAHQEGDQGNPGRLTRRDQPPTTADLVSGEVPTPAGLNHKLRACASRWSWAATRAAVPAVLSPGAADQPATDDDGAGQRQPELDHQPAPLGAPAQLPVLVTPGVGALDRPPRLTWIGAGTPRMAIWPTIPRSVRTFRQ